MTSPAKDGNVRHRKKGGTGGAAEVSATTPSKPKSGAKSGPPATADVHASPTHSRSQSRSHSQLQQHNNAQTKSERRLVLWLAAAGAVLLPLVLLPPALMVEEGPVSELLHDSLGLPRLNVTLPPLPSIVALDALLASAGFAVPGAALNGTAGGAVNGSAINGLLTLFGVTGDMASAGMDGLTNRTVTAAQQLRAFLAQLPALSISGAPAVAGVPSPGAGAGAEVNATAAADETSGLRPGQVMARRGYRSKHPVVIVPGFVTSGLELWRGLPCGQRYFRQRMWGTLAMVQAFLTDAACWFRHMELDTVSGLDPEGIKLRAALGLEAVDFFIQGYWVWGKLVEALADIGYDSNTLVSMPYDWRLAVPLLEERDGYFTRLRRTIEQLVELTGERVVVTSHSYGENVFRAFMHWVESAAAAEEEGAAGGGKRRSGGSGHSGGGWVDRHLATYINIAGTSLGVPKSISALLSGETRDTAQLGALAGFLTSNMVPRATRTRVWRSWGASYAMLPVGGPAVWGNATWAPDDTPEMRANRRTFGSMVSLWPHNWQALMSAAPQPQREQLSKLVADVSQDVDGGDGDGGSSGGSSGEDASAGGSGGGNSGGAAVAAAEAAAAAGGTGDGDDATGEAAAAPAAAAAAAAAAPAAAANSTESNSTTASNSTTGPAGGTGSSSSSSGSSSSSSSKAIAAIADTIKKLVGGGGVDAADFLNSSQVTRLDVSGFIALLREVGGPLVAANIAQWGALQLPTEEAVAAAEAVRKRAAAASERAAAAASPAAQAVGGADRVKDSTAGGAGAAGIGRGASSAGGGRVALFPDATRTPLPNAPKTAMVCLYGIGLPTERGYHYLRPPPPTGAAAAATAAAANAPAGNTTAAALAADAQQQRQQTAAAGGDAVVTDGTGEADAVRGVPPRGAGAAGEEANPDAGGDASSGWMIMRDVTQAQSSLDVGVHLSDGDGTVPLLSLGLMCRGGWRERGHLNPGGMKVVTREYKHKAVSMLQDARGGPAAAAHIDILGNDAVLRDVLMVAAGRADELTDIVISDIDRMAAAVDWAALAA